MSKARIYLDYNATAPLLPEARAAMIAVFDHPSNPSSVHSYGRAARSYVETAREQIASLVKTQASSVIFTGGATEANNSILKSFADQTIWISAIEHASVLDAAPHAIQIPVTPDGVIDIEAFKNMLDEATEEPALISVMMANNETGVIQPVEEIARLAKKAFPKTHIHTDAVQAPGRLDIDFPALQVDYMTLSAHKFGGAPGVGALIKAPGAQDVKYIFGGGQEKRQRAGTENVAGIVSMGVAAQIAGKQTGIFATLIEKRNHIENHMQETIPALHILGKNVPRLANTVTIALPHMPSDTQLIALDMEGIAVSSGAACSSGSMKTSHVGKAMGLNDAEIGGAYRISMGLATTDEEIDRFLEIWTKIVTRMQKNYE